MSVENPSLEILAGRRALDGIPGYERLEDIIWDSQEEKFRLKCRLTSKGSALVPATSDWVVFIDPIYPWGEIKFHPCSVNSITTTLPHMSFNGKEREKSDWRTGALCLDTTVASLNRQDISGEVFSATGRLKWHVGRALKWIELACDDRLLENGHPFELPVFPTEKGDFRVYATSESRSTIAFWAASTIRSGFFNSVCLRDDLKLSDIRIVLSFCAENEAELLKVSWGEIIRQRIESLRKQSKQALYQETGIWILIPGIPIKKAWEVPGTWTELATACKTHGFDINAEIRKYIPSLRTGNRHTLLLGFPIPEIVGQPDKLIHWRALNLPEFASDSTPPKGFRKGNAAAAYRDKVDLAKLLAAEVSYIPSENWHRLEITSRGTISRDLASQKVAVLGAGAFGSIFSEQLARNGFEDVLVMDPDCLVVGNLTRHSLGLGEVGLPKATSVATAMLHANPHVSAIGLFESFPPSKDEDIESLQMCDLVVDCTGSDSVLPELEKFSWGEQVRSFASFSMGLNGKRMFCFYSRSKTFPMNQFREKIKPWLLFEGETLGENHPREGTGCWHSVFPARIDDVQLFVSAAIKFLEGKLAANEEADHFVVFEQVHGTDGFQGIRRIEGPPTLPTRTI